MWHREWLFQSLIGTVQRLLAEDQKGPWVVVSIPHRYGSKGIAFPCHPVFRDGVSIPHRYGSKLLAATRRPGGRKQVSIPHRYGSKDLHSHLSTP